MIKKHQLQKILAVCGLWCAASIVAADYSQHPAATQFINEMVEQHGFDKTQITQWLSQAQKQQSIIDAISRPAEKTKTWGSYQKIFLTKTRIDKGKMFWDEHKDTLEKAEKQYRVPAQVIVSIIGVETQYGGNAGKYEVPSALATLAFDYPPRSPFFTKELREFFLMVRDENIKDPFALVGSYAGAMGYGQFMPSSFRAYAVDFDGDGQKDIWHNPVDAIGSVANYLNKHGWQGDTGIALATTFTGEDYKALASTGLEPNHTIKEVKQADIKPTRCVPSDTNVLVMALEGDNGTEVWLGLKNFQVITTYNRSQLYAMAVFQLSEALRRE